MNGCLLAGRKALRDARPLFENSTVCQLVDAMLVRRMVRVLTVWWVVWVCGVLVWLM